MKLFSPKAEMAWLDPMCMRGVTLAHYRHIQCTCMLVVCPVLQDALNSIHLDLAAADVSGFHLGVKLVRGAYLEQERQLAKEKGMPVNHYS